LGKNTTNGQFGASNMPRKERTARTVSVVDSPISNPVIAASNININSTSSPSPIYRLPLEIRRIIYCFVIGERDVDIRELDRRCQPCGPCKRSTKCLSVGLQRKTPRLQDFRTKPSLLAIAATCQQLYHEAMKIWYGKARFFFECLRCMKQFLEEIGDANQNTVRYIGYFAPGRPNEKEIKEVRHLVSAFTSLRSLTIEDNGWWGNYKQREYHRKWIDESLERWQGEAHNLLRLWDRLESVVLTTKTLRYQITENS
jgi:hypothetical protein